MLNLITNDTQKLIDAGTYFHFVWFSLVEISAICTLTIIEAGVSAVPGVILVFLLQPVPVWMGWAVGHFRRKAIKYTDTRITLLGEILSGIKTVKYNGWTAPFLGFIAQIRDSELKYITRAAFFKSSTSTLKDGVTPLASLIVFGTYVGIHGKLSASMSFTVLALLSVLVRVFNIAPAGVQYVGEARVAVQRIQRLLNVPNGSSSREDGIEKISPASVEVSVFIKDGWFSWVIPEENVHYPSTHPNISEQGSKKSRIQVEPSLELVQGLSSSKENRVKAVLRDINITIKKGKLIGLMGHVGSGKSSFLLSLLGETECLHGVYFTEKPVAYVPQQPWILNDNVRNNILFGVRYDASRYCDTINACALHHDVSYFPAGHDTEIGERGVNLSGGQKARISLARACYSYAPLVLLDDPFAAVDASTANHLMQHVLLGVLKGRTIILASHNRKALACCDEIYTMDDGKLQAITSVVDIFEDPNGITIMEEETQDVERPSTSNEITDFQLQHENSINSEKKVKHPFENLLKDKDHNGLSSNSSSEVEPEAPVVSDPTGDDKKGFGKAQSTATDTDKGALTMKEDRVEGHVTWSTYISYLQAGGGFSFFTFVMVIFLFSQAVRVMVNYWLSVWSDEKYHLKTQVYVGSYAFFVMGTIILSFIQAIMFTKMTMKSTKGLHSKMIVAVLRSPQLFFDQNPSGRILNRLGKDQAIVDELLPNSAQSMMENLIGCLGSIAMIAVVIPWFLLALPPFMFLFFYLQCRYTAVSRELKRLDGISRSPVYAYFTETLQGITSVRAYGQGERLHEQFSRLIDANHRAYILFVHLSRWFALRLDFSATICITMAALLVVLLRHSIAPGLAGVVLVQSLQLTGLFQYGVRMAADTENFFTSVERIQKYTNLPVESQPHTSPGVITDGWPGKGEVEFVNYTMAYREDLAPVLQDVSFKVEAQEKIGILGRTGAGKSTLASALFRMVENTACSGCILIDGIDIKLVGLDDLRQRLSIIPQDPVLFKETVRVNLDPFERHTDSEIFEALDRVQLTKKIKSLDRGLYAVITNNGDNFSVGECQLLCLARSLLRRSRIVVMDEATAAVDEETDELIQTVLKSEFKECTVFTIAHRINTVIYCDRLLVLAHAGRISEFDSPANLLRHAEESFEGGEHLFANMVANTGHETAKILIKAAEAAERARMQTYEQISG